MLKMLRFLTFVLIPVLLVGGMSPVAGQQIDDQTITSDIEAKLFQDSVLKTRDLHVKTENGVVTLSGNVHTDLEKSAVDRIASTEPGVKQVVDSLIVADDTRATGSGDADAAGSVTPACAAA